MANTRGTIQMVSSFIPTRRFHFENFSESIYHRKNLDTGNFTGMNFPLGHLVKTIS